MSILNAFFAWRVRRHTRTLEVGGRLRSYYVYVPPGLSTQKPIPVVLALHGATMNGPLLAWFTGLNRKADEAGFVVVYPNGTGRRSSFYWNGGNCCGSAVAREVDDVAFIRALLDDLATSYRVDARRVFVTGLSNGAIMAYRLASELADRIAAIAPVAGTMGTAECHPSRPVPVLHLHGTEDEYVPFIGGTGNQSSSGANHFSVEHSIAAWVQANGCQGEPTVEEVPDEAKDGTRVTKKTFGGGRDGAEVVLVVIHGGGHTWPGRPARSTALGRATKNVTANDLIWSFFEKHPLA